MNQGHHTDFRPRIVGPLVTKDTLGRRVARGVVESLEQWWKWSERAQQRQSLRSLPDHLLRDIGVSRCDAEQECGKPLWRA